MKNTEISAEKYLTKVAKCLHHKKTNHSDAFWHLIALIHNRNVLNQLLATLKTNVLQIKYLCILCTR